IAKRTEIQNTPNAIAFVIDFSGESIVVAKLDSPNAVPMHCNRVLILTGKSALSVRTKNHCVETSLLAGTCLRVLCMQKA
ncbi:hypothetical protein L0244_34055, partial [bacterium]|nr:hypothetical protein [bacterium]